MPYGFFVIGEAASELVEEETEEQKRQKKQKFLFCHPDFL